MNFNEFSKIPDASSRTVSKALVKKLDMIIGSGGDLRLKKTSKHMNKYFVSPIPHEKVLNRGSCTCSPFTTEAFLSACDVLASLDNENFEAYKERQTIQLKSLINKHNRDDFDIFYAPSGSDLCYFPLAFS